MNARDASERSCVCTGGSVKIIISALIIGSGPMNSSTVLCADENVTGSLCARSTSAKRVSA